MAKPAALEKKMHRRERACASPQTPRPRAHSRAPAATSNFLSVTICLLVVVFVAGLFANTALGQSMTKEEYLQYVRSGKDQVDLAKEQEKNKVPHVPYKSKSLSQWLAETREFFKKAEANLNTKEEKDLLAACQKMREAFLILSACKAKGPEVCRAAYTGPFFSKEGRRDDQFMVQILFIRAGDSYIAAGEEYLKLRSKTSESAQAQVAMALYKEKDMVYEVERIQLALRFTGKPPLAFFPVECISEYSKGPVFLGESQDQGYEQRWKQIFKDLNNPNIKEPKPGSIKPMGRGNYMFQYDLELLMNPGCPIGAVDKMISRDEFLFISRQTDQAWQNLLNPPEISLKKDPPEFTYWQRDPEANEPPLVLKVQILRYPYPSGNTGGVIMHHHLPNSFLKGLCPEWKQVLADFKKSLPTDGVAQDCIGAWNSGRELKVWENGRLIRPLSDAEKKWRGQLYEKEDELYLRYFAKERLKWHRISADEYAKLKADQEEWVRTHPESPSFAEKQKLCSSFQRLAVTYNDCSSCGQSGPLPYTAYSLEAIESAQIDKVEVVTNSPKANPPPPGSDVPAPHSSNPTASSGRTTTSSSTTASSRPSGWIR